MLSTIIKRTSIAVIVTLLSLSHAFESQAHSGRSSSLGIEIDDITVSGTTATIDFELDADYTESYQPFVVLMRAGSPSDVHDLVDMDQGNTPYSTDVEMNQTQGTFTVFLVYPTSATEWDGVGREFTVDENGTVTIDDGGMFPKPYLTFLGLSPLPFTLIDHCPTCADDMNRGPTQAAASFTDDTIFKIPVGIIDGGSTTGGCSTCGGSASAGQTSLLAAQLLVQPHNAALGGSAGPGVFLQYAPFIYVTAADYDNGDDVSFRVHLPLVGKSLTLRDDYDASAGTYTGTLDGVLEGKYTEFKEVKLVNGSGTAVAVLADATEIWITRIDGVKHTYALWDIEQSGEDDDDNLDMYARLVKITDRCGVDVIECTYGSTTTGNPTKIEDRFGNHVDLLYTSTIVGRPALTSVTFNDHTATTITYANDFINEVTYPGGAKWKCTIAHDSTTQTEKLTIESPCDGKKYYRLTEDFMIYDDDIVNQPSAVLRAISDSNDDNLMSVFFNPSDSAQARLWYAGDKLALYHNDEFSRYIRYYTAWTLGDIDDGWSAFTSLTLETNYASLDFTPFTGGTDQELAFGAAPIFTTPTGETVSCTYGDAYHVEMQEYDDGSYEAWDYDSYYNMTRHRDRNGNVTKYVYDSCGNVTERKVGIKDTGTKTAPNDVNQTEYAVYKYDYFTTPTAKKGLLKTEKTARWTTETDLYRTDYAYDADGRLTTVTEAADAASGTRPVTTYTYYTTWTRKLKTVEDPEDRETEFFYDTWGRRYKTEYHDDSTEIDFYGSTGEECLVVKRKARDGVTTLTDYDAEGRVEKVTRGYSTMNAAGTTETVNTDALTKSITDYTYDGDSSQVDYQITDGKKTSYVYDYKFRTTETKTYPYTSKTLTNKTVYSTNRVFYSEDPYGRRLYYGYSESNSTSTIRTIQCTDPAKTYATNTAVLNATRDSSNNAEFIIADAIRDAEGNILEMIDGRNIKTAYTYDSRNRATERLDADSKTIEAKTETYYDKDNNVTEVRGPRYFDSNDTDGYQKAKITHTYTGRGLRASTTDAAGQSVAATTSLTYHLDGRVNKTTDGRSNDWYSYWHACCGRPQGNKDPAGHGSITNNDYLGRVTHSAVVADYSTHTNLHNPTDSKTLSESTASYDILGRPSARTQWLVARGTVDENDPPIAGLGGVSAADGITSQTIYDSNLKDNVGLDNSTGASVDKLGGGTFNLSLANAITKLADTVANGGAGITFTTNVSAGSAIVSINGEEEISFSISDAAGRTVISGQIQSHADTSPNTLIVHSCVKHDTEVTITGWGEVLETQAIDPDGEVVKSRADGAGRALETEDQDGNISTAEYDANSNAVERRNANGVGADMAYDDLNRVTKVTDTWSDEVETSYYLSGMVHKRTDAKDKFSEIAYDSRGRRKTVTDRLDNDTTYTYDKNNNPLSITDAESRITSYTYNSRNLNDKITYPDHVSGNPGDSGYGIVEFDHDEAGRAEVKTDQLGDTVTFDFDLAGRMTQRDYRLKVNSPSGTIADSDEFTYDKASRMLSAESGRYSNTASMTYDMAGRLEDESLEIGSKTYTISRDYNSLGQLSKLTYPDTTEVERAYTDRGQLYTVKYAGTIVDTRVYDVGGRLSTSTYDNGVVATYNYRSSAGDKDNLINSIVTTNNGTEKIGTYTYTYDANKNKTKETITGSSINNKSFDTTAGTDPDGYDDDDRLTYWKRSDNNRKLEWTLTDVGDWSALKLNGTSTSRTHNNAHELTAVGSTNITYDVKGNLLSDATKSQDYTWDFDNKLVDIDTDGDSSADNEAKYDALGRRVQWGATGALKTYVYAGRQIVARYNDGGATNAPNRRFVYASYIDEPILIDYKTSVFNKYYYSRNQQYSITGLTDSSGNVVERYVYDAYGNTTIYDAAGTTTRSYSNYGNAFAYTGRFYHASLEIYHFRARMYDPDLGRFISRDPLGYVDGMSLYRGYFGPNGLDPHGTVKLNIQIRSFIHEDVGTKFNNLAIRTFGGKSLFKFSNIDISRTPNATRRLIRNSTWFQSPAPTDWISAPFDNRGGLFVSDVTPWYYRTDSRKEYETGTSRAMHDITLDTKDVGKMKGKATVLFMNDPTFGIRHFVRPFRIPITVVKEGSAKFGSSPTIVDDAMNCKSVISDKVSGGDPLVFLWAPHLDYDFKVIVSKCKTCGSVSVKAVLKHDRFPDYEVLVNGKGIYHYKGEFGVGKGGANLLISAGSHTIQIYP